MMNKKDIEEYHNNIKKVNKSLKVLPKLNQDVVKSVTQTSLNKKYGDLVENIIQRKLNEKTKA